MVQARATQERQSVAVTGSTRCSVRESVECGACADCVDYEDGGLRGGGLSGTQAFATVGR